MAPLQFRAEDSPRNRAELARSRANSLSDHEIIYVDRLGPRILCVPSNPVKQLSREILRELNKGNWSASLGRGTVFLANRMIQCPEIAIATNGQYTVKRLKSNTGDQATRSFTVKTLNVWTGKPGDLQQNRDITDLIFYSMRADQLPTYHSWKGERLERREASLEAEKRQEAVAIESNKAAPQKSLHAMIEEHRENREATAAREASDDPENMLRLRPTINLNDHAWEGAEEYFKWILNYERQENPDAPKINRVLGDEFLESQRLLAIPATNSGYRAKIQDEHTEKYYEALRTTFQGRPDNLVTKLTMLCFGLPIAPLTLPNIKFGGGPEDVPSDSSAPKEVDGLVIQQILWSEKPLEFLDCYNERSYGYPIIRSAKRQYKLVDTEIMKEVLEQAEQLAKNPYIEFGACGTSQMEDLGLDLHLRGGGMPKEKKSSVYTELGIFRFMGFNDLVKTLDRVFRLESDRNWEACQWDLVPIIKTEKGIVINESKKPRYFRWARAKKNDRQPDSYENFMSPTRIERREWAFRVRVIDKSTAPKIVQLDGRDRLMPEDHPSLVYIAMRGEGISYWYLPTKPQGINVLEETFRNAVECLIPYHRLFDIEWEIAGRAKGHIRLASEGPSTALWDAVQKALDSPGRVQVNIRKSQDCSHSELAVKVLMPGQNLEGWYDRLPDHDMWKANTKGFALMRTLASRKIGRSTALRLWGGVENYDSREDTDWRRSVVLPAEHDDAEEQNVWMGANLGYTWDSVFIRPDFDEYQFICINDKRDLDTPLHNFQSMKLSPEDGFITLQRFKGVVSRLIAGFNPKEDYIAIEQPKVHQTFIVGPGMTDGEWRLQIFDWLITPTIMFRQQEKCPPLYAINVIDGPFGPITNYGSINRTLDPSSESAGSAQVPCIGPVFVGTDTSQPPGIVIESEASSFEELSSLARWKDWRARQDVEEQRRIEAYTANETIYRDELNPQIPKFGPASESHIPIVGPKFPIIYTGLATATDNVERDKVTRELLNIVLERQDFCGVCETAIPSGDHAFGARRLHFQSHRDQIRKAEAKKGQEIEVRQGTGQDVVVPGTKAQGKNASDNGHQNTVARNVQVVFYGSKGEVYYCEYCGKTPDEYKKENNRLEHGPVCALKETFNRIPQYCQYCRLNFWTNEVAEASVQEHVEKCAKDRRVTLRGQIHLYQILLSRSLGHGQPNGESTCHFSNCDQIFDAGTTNFARALHFWNHIDNEDDERQPCLFPQCMDDLNDLSTPEVLQHLAHHKSQPGQPDQPVQPVQPDQSVSISDICPFKSCNQNFTGWTQNKIAAHLTTHGSHKCLWPSCGFTFEKSPTPITIEEHMRIHGLHKVADTDEPSQGDAVSVHDEDDDNVPESLKDANPGKNFYCPKCLKLVSGKTPSPCKRHRGGDCNVHGHANWLVLKADDIKALRDAAGGKRKSKTAAAPSKKKITTKKKKLTPASKKVISKPTKKASNAGYVPGKDDSGEETSNHGTDTRSNTKRKAVLGANGTGIESPTKKRKTWNTKRVEE